MKNKDDPSVSETFEEMLKEANEAPTIITSDNDSTFLSQEMQKIFNKYGIIHDVAPKNDHNSLGIIDRFARTLKTILHKKIGRAHV